MKRSRGFTLIELMITVAIIAILAAIAIPSYSEYVRRGRITEAVSTLCGNAGEDGAVLPGQPHVRRCVRRRRPSRPSRRTARRISPTPAPHLGADDLHHHCHGAGRPGRLRLLDRPEQRPLDRHDGAVDLAEQRDVLGAEEGRLVLSALRSARLHARRAARRPDAARAAARARRPGDGNVPAELEARQRRRELLQRPADGAHRGDPAQRADRVRSHRHADFDRQSRQRGRRRRQRQELARAGRVRCGVRRSGSQGRCGRRRQRRRRRDPGHRRRPLLRPSSTAGSRSTASARTADGGALRIDITNPAAGTCVQSGGKVRCRRITVSPGGQIAVLRSGGGARRETAVRADLRRALRLLKAASS